MKNLSLFLVLVGTSAFAETQRAYECSYQTIYRGHVDAKENFSLAADAKSAATTTVVSGSTASIGRVTNQTGSGPEAAVVVGIFKDGKVISTDYPESLGWARVSLIDDGRTYYISCHSK